MADLLLIKNTIHCLRIKLKYGYILVKSMTMMHAAPNAINTTFLGEA